MDVNSINSRLPQELVANANQTIADVNTAADAASQLSTSEAARAEEAAASALGPVFSSLLLNILNEAQSNGSSGA